MAFYGLVFLILETCKLLLELFFLSQLSRAKHELANVESITCLGRNTFLISETNEPVYYY